jgi:hypothetical protein
MGEIPQILREEALRLNELQLSSLTLFTEIQGLQFESCESSL